MLQFLIIIFDFEIEVFLKINPKITFTRGYQIKSIRKKLPDLDNDTAYCPYVKVYLIKD